MNIDYTKARMNAIYCQEVYGKFDDSLRFSEITDPPFFIEDQTTDTQGAILSKDGEIIIVFRGTSASSDWETNLDTAPERDNFDAKVIQDVILAKKDREQINPYPTTSSSGAVMHRGFSKAYASVRQEIHTYINTHDILSFTATGHSLGGALATLCAIDIQYNYAEKIPQIEAYTYGSPKVGNDGFRNSYHRRVPNSYRFVNGLDIVADLPRWWQGQYRHVNHEIRLGKRISWNFISNRFKDHNISRYIDELDKRASGL